MLKSFFLKNRLSFAENRFFVDYRFWRHSDVWLLQHTALLWGLMQPSRWVMERQAYKQTGQTRRLNRRPPHVASYSSFTLPRYETMPHRPSMTGTPTGGHAGQSPSPLHQWNRSVTGNIHSAAASVGEERGERHVVNNGCETTCTSWRRPPSIMPPLNGGGEGGENMSFGLFQTNNITTYLLPRNCSIRHVLYQKERLTNHIQSTADGLLSSRPSAVTPTSQ